MEIPDARPLPRTTEECAALQHVKLPTLLEPLYISGSDVECNLVQEEEQWDVRVGNVADHGVCQVNTCGKALASIPGSVQSSAFTPLEKVPSESAPWQNTNMLRKTGVQIVVVPPGAGSFAIIGHFAQYLTGITPGRWAPAKYPGDVLFSTYTPHLERSLKVALCHASSNSKNIFIQQTQRRFNWKMPMLAFEEIEAKHQPGELAALIIDTGPRPGFLDEAIVEAATVALHTLSEKLGCLVLLIVEAVSRSIDPFERVPQCLRFLRGTLLVVPMRSKAMVPQENALPEFMLLGLPEASASAPRVRFQLVTSIDMMETCRIEWGKFSYGDPREAFRQAETLDLTVAQRAAVTLAAKLINAYGPMSAEALRAAAMSNGIPSTTMRDALTVARELGHLDKFFDRDRDRRWLWFIPGTPNSSRLPY